MTLFRRLLLSALGSLTILSGAQAEPGVSDSTITLGMSLPLTGQAKIHAEEIRQVTTAYFEQINKSGGIHGRKVDLVVLDDGYEADRAVTNTNTLVIDKKVFALVSYYGSNSMTEAMNKAFGPAGVPLIGGISGALTLRQSPATNPNNRYMFNLRASYADEAEAIGKQLVTLGLQNIAVLYQNDGYGKAGLDGITETLKKSNLAPSAVASVERNSEDVSKAFETIAKANPQAVVLVTLAKPAAALIKALHKVKQNPMFMALSPAGGDLLTQELGNSARGVGISQVVPYPWNDTLPIVKEYQRFMGGKKEHYGYISMEAYLMARITAEALRKAGKDVTREKLVQALESTNQDLGGYRVTFSPGNRSGSRFVELTVIGPGGKLMK